MRSFAAKTLDGVPEYFVGLPVIEITMTKILINLFLLQSGSR